MAALSLYLTGPRTPKLSMRRPLLSLYRQCTAGESNLTLLKAIAGPFARSKLERSKGNTAPALLHASGSQALHRWH